MANTLQFGQILRNIHKAQDKIAPLIEGLEDEIPQQSMQDYFVKLQIIVNEDQDKDFAGNYETISGEKKEVELADIFNQLPGDATSSPTQLLVMGGAGVGKTTLMQYIAYRWGTGDLWKDKFDYIYRVSLKTLLNDHWKDDYSKEELREDILKCLVHYNLVMRLQDDIDEPSLKEMHWSSTAAETEKTLLLLDGYDEIAHLKNSNNPSKDYQRLEKKIFEHKNLIFTSRPNAISKAMKSQFDKVFENTGLSKSGIEHYFSTYFRGDKKGKEAELRSLLAGNQTIWQICTIPVNIAMVCYIWSTSTSKSSDDLRQISTISGLYKNVIDRLGQRYFAKEWNSDDKTDKVTLEEALTNGKFTLDEFRVLAHVAYKALTGGGINVAEKDRIETLIIRGGHDKDGEIDLEDEDGISVLSSINYLANRKMIQDDQKKKVTVTKVYRYGLLKVEGTVASINNKKSDTNATRMSYSFIHLTFQEYLAAYYLKIQLTSDHVSEKEKREICQFIAEHRNEPRYLMMLKFLAGIVTADQSAKAEDLVKLFWDAMICNVDGVIELGIETKVSVMIHLLTQTKIRGKIDSRIPHKDEMILLIDAVVLNNLFEANNQLKETGYNTDTIKEAVFRAFIDDNLTWSNNKLTQICAQTSSSLRVALQKMRDNPTDKEVGKLSGTISALALRMVMDLNLKLTADECRTFVNKLKGVIKACVADEKQTQWKLLKQAIEALKKSVQESSFPLSDDENIDFINILVQVPPNNGLIELAIETIVQIVQASGKEAIAAEAINKLSALVTPVNFDQTNFLILIIKTTVQIARLIGNKTLRSLGFEKLNAYLMHGQEITQDYFRNPDKILELDRVFAESIGELLAGGGDKEKTMENLESLFNRAKMTFSNLSSSLESPLFELVTSTETLAVIVSSFDDKEMISRCINLLAQFLSEKEKLSQRFAQLALIDLGKAVKDKTVIPIILEAVDGLIKNNHQDSEELKALSIRILCEASAMTEDMEVVKREAQKIFKTLAGIKKNQSLAASGLLGLVIKCKDKELAIKLMEYIITNNCSVEEDLIKLVMIIKDQKEVMTKIVDHINRIFSGDISVGALSKPGEADEIKEGIKKLIVLLEVLNEKVEANKISADILAALQKVLPPICDKFANLLISDCPEDLKDKLRLDYLKIIEFEKVLTVEKRSKLFEIIIMDLLSNTGYQRNEGIFTLRSFMERTKIVSVDLAEKFARKLFEISFNERMPYDTLNAIYFILSMTKNVELTEKIWGIFFDVLTSTDKDEEVKDTAMEGIWRLTELIEDEKLAVLTEKFMGKLLDLVSSSEDYEIKDRVISEIADLIPQIKNGEVARKVAEKLMGKVLELLIDENQRVRTIARQKIYHFTHWTKNGKLDVLTKRITGKSAEKLFDLLTNENLEMKEIAISGINTLFQAIEDDELTRKFAGKLFDLLSDENLEIKKMALSGIGNLISLVKDYEIAGKLADILTDEGLGVKGIGPIGIGIFASFLKYDELIVKLKDPFVQALKELMDSIAVAVPENKYHKQMILMQTTAICQDLTNKEVAEKVIEVALNLIPSNKDCEENLLELVDMIIVRVGDGKFAVKTLEKMRQRNENYRFKDANALALAGEDRVIIEILENYLSHGDGGEYGEMASQGLGIIGSLLISSEQLLKYIQHPITSLRGRIWKQLNYTFETF